MCTQTHPLSIMGTQSDKHYTLHIVPPFQRGWLCCGCSPSPQCPVVQTDWRQLTCSNYPQWSDHTHTGRTTCHSATCWAWREEQTKQWGGYMNRFIYLTLLFLFSLTSPPWGWIKHSKRKYIKELNEYMGDSSFIIHIFLFYLETTGEYRPFKLMSEQGFRFGT